MLKQIAAQQPREQLQRSGAQTLTDAQLVALLLRTGTSQQSALQCAQQLLQTYPLQTLETAQLEQLQQISGVGPTKALTLKAAIEFGRRVQQAHYWRYGTVVSSEMLGQRMLERLAGIDQEQLWGLYLDTKNQILLEKCLFVGTLNTSVAHPREIFQIAVQVAAARFILVHNHPSGQTAASHYDLRFTERVQHCGELMGIELLDHLIVGQDAYLSLKASGQLA